MGGGVGNRPETPAFHGLTAFSTSPTVPGTPACSPHITHSPEAFTPPSGPLQHTHALTHTHTHMHRRAYMCTQTHIHTLTHMHTGCGNTSPPAGMPAPLWRAGDCPVQKGAGKSRYKEAQKAGLLGGGRQRGIAGRAHRKGGGVRRPRLPDSRLSVTLRLCSP